MTRAPWQLTVFVLIMLPTVVALGFWQLDRAEEKQKLENAFAVKLSKPATSPGEKIEPFDRITLKGTWGNQQFLVDNQIHQGSVGYWVLQNFVEEEGRVFLVNRGWIKAPVSRDQLPDAPAPDGTVVIFALAWPQLGKPLMFGADPWPGEEKVRVQSRDMKRMAAMTGAIPMELRLEDGSPGGLVAAPQDVQFGKAMHIGYAVQWFGLGIVMIIGYCVVCRRSRRGRMDD